MSDRPEIEVRDLGKRYRLGSIGATTLRDSLARFARRCIGPKKKGRKSPEEFWALRDVTFDVKGGEVLGVIGHNGAGKSTLLKVLSRITEPTLGEAKLRGRVASLLEVGTGFHPELTGRENAYLNGAILGMRKDEITNKLEAIAEFAGVEEFLDTPVKRYSSGMRVRLAFAVAAHLEPEILIIDEVLAVGDAAFQQKCLGKIDEVARSGRTVLFVSHNMGSIQSFCSRVIVMDGGEMVFDGSPSEGVERYFQSFSKNEGSGSYTRTESVPKGTRAWITFAKLVGPGGTPCTEVITGDSLEFEVEIVSETALTGVELGLGIFNSRGVRVCTMHTHCDPGLDLSCERGSYRLRCRAGHLTLAKGPHHIRMQLKNGTDETADTVPLAFSFQVMASDFFKNGGKDASGAVLVPQKWTIESLDERAGSRASAAPSSGDPAQTPALTS